MSERFLINVYSDESRHSGNHAGYMVIGSVWGKPKVTKAFKDKVLLIKAQHDIAKYREIKWTKVSPAKLDYYKDLVELFFEEDGLNFRAVIIPTSQLRHKDFGQTEDDFYYKMQYTMLSNIARKHGNTDFKIYLDFKDTWSNVRAGKLAKYLSRDSSHGSRASGSVFAAQPIRSYESSLMQLADLLIGAVAYAHNEPSIKGAKGELVKLITEMSGQPLDQDSPYGVDKFNIFMWQPRTE